VQHWQNQDACCANGGAFGEGCSAAPAPVPCFVVDSYYPDRSCRKEEDIAVCNRGGCLPPNILLELYTSTIEVLLAALPDWHVAVMDRRGRVCMMYSDASP
jgi:hypothetical protein